MRGVGQVPGPVNRPWYFSLQLPGRRGFDIFQKYHLRAPGSAKSWFDACASQHPDGHVAECGPWPQKSSTTKVWSWWPGGGEGGEARGNWDLGQGPSGPGVGGGRKSASHSVRAGRVVWADSDFLHLLLLNSLPMAGTCTSFFLLK